MKKRRFKSKKRQKHLFKWLFLTGLFFCLLIGAVYFLIFSSYLWISQLELETDRDSKYYQKEEVEKIIWESLNKKVFQIVSQKNIVLAPIETIQKQVLERMPQLSSITLQRRLPNTLLVKIEERQSIGVWCQAQRDESGLSQATSTQEQIEEPKQERRVVKQCFLIDKQGIVFKETLLVKSTLLINIYDLKDQKIRLGQEAVLPNIMKFILALNQELGKTEGKKREQLFLGADFEIISIEDVRMATSAGWQIYFNPAYSAVSQVRALQALLDKEEILFEYIDLRIKGRAYYK